MQPGTWLSLTDYSSKYRISVSTLRRRIKADQIDYRLEGGKYLLLDVPPAEGSEITDDTWSQPTQLRLAAEPAPLKAEMSYASAPVAPPKNKPVSERRDMTDPSFEERSVEEPIISTATKLLNELKKAYMSILQEKEEQIIQLKEEVADLKTLVRVLEEDNERMKSILHPQK